MEKEINLDLGKARSEAAAWSAAAHRAEGGLLVLQALRNRMGLGPLPQDTATKK